MMGEDRNIKNIEDLLVSKINQDEKIADVEISRLTAPGENYGSIMLRILITLENTKSKEKRALDTVGKIIPDSEITRQIFHTQDTYTLEYQFYSVVVPTFDAFLKKNQVSTGADFLAPFVGGRLNLNGGPVVDSDAIIVLENLRASGYTTGNKSIGLDLDHSKVVLESLAKFHAAGLGLRLTEPETFDKNVRPYVFKYDVVEELHTMVTVNVSHYLKKSGFSDQEIERVAKVIDQPHIAKVSDVWGTMIHYDSWTNNLLIKCDNGKPSHCVLVDFQVPDYGTPLDDVTFFLFTSVQKLFIGNTFEDLLTFYYDKLIENLQLVSVNTDLFTRKSFDEEVGIAIKNYQYYHTMWMLHPLMCEGLHSVDQFMAEDATNIVKWTDEHVKKIANVTRLCFDKKWF